MSMSRTATWKTILPLTLVAVAAASRLVPHVWNVSPLGAIALFAGWRYGQKGNWLAALAIPLAALFLSDLALNNFVYHLGPSSGQAWVWFYPGAVWTYAAIALITCWGWLALRRLTSVRLAGTSLGASCLFFLLSNFGVWQSAQQFTPPMYPHTLAGLGECYVAGLPFFSHTMLGDLLFCGLLFGAYHLAAKTLEAPAIQSA